MKSTDNWWFYQDSKGQWRWKRTTFVGKIVGYSPAIPAKRTVSPTPRPAVTWASRSAGSADEARPSRDRIGEASKGVTPGCENSRRHHHHIEDDGEYPEERIRHP